MTFRTLRLRHILLTGVALAFAHPAFAQAVQASAAPVGGSTGLPSTAAIFGGQRDTVRVNAPTAVINWQPNDVAAGSTAIDFLPANNELRFISALPTYTVLNRVIPAGLAAGRTIAINGGVDSFVNVPIGVAPQQRGGNIWFYSPNGILVGNSGRFNVGSLALTTLDHPFNAVTGALTFGGGGAFRFGSGSNPVVPTSNVTISPFATIFANNVANSYVAVISPQITMGGTVTVNGSAAYLAAEQVDVSVNGGLFDIAFLAGTGATTALTHSGTTTGPAQVNGRIVMAAMPKNSAITMLIGGTIGYTPAATAVVQNGTVVLSSGHDIVFGGSQFQPNSALPANITLTGGTFSSEVFARASGSITGAPAVDLTFTSNATLNAATAVSLTANAGRTITVGGGLIMQAASGGVGGTVGLTINDGAVNAGFLSMDTTARGAFGGLGTGGNATGGQARLTMNGGTATFADTVSILSDGIGGEGVARNGDGTAGLAAITLNAGATAPTLTMNGLGNQIGASGFSGGGQVTPLIGGAATGGASRVTVNAGQMTSRDVGLFATATGGFGTDQGGNARGGTAQVLVAGGRYDVETLGLSADEQQAGAGNGGIAGATFGTGIAAVDVTGGVLSVGASGGNAVRISADAIKGLARVTTPASGGNLTAGTARLSVAGTGIVLTDATAPSAPKQPVVVTASVINADAAPGAPSANLRGGTATVEANGGTMTLHAVRIFADALQRAPFIPNDPAGPATAGTATLAARNGGRLTINEQLTRISAVGSGGSDIAPALGTGGAINVLAEGGTLAAVNGLNADARGYSGLNQAGTGGSIAVASRTGIGASAGSISLGVTTLDASGQASAADPNGTAGAITVSNIGIGQAMTFGSLDAVAGTGFTAASGSIAIVADNAPITVTNGTSLRTLGNLDFTMTGLAGRIDTGFGLSGSASNITVSHLGVTPGTNLTTIAANQVTLEAGNVFLPGNDLTFVGPATIRAGSITVAARRDIGGLDGALFATGDVQIGNARNVSFRTVDANGALIGWNGASSTTPFLNLSGAVQIRNSLRIGTGNIDVRAVAGIDIADAGTAATGQVLLSSTAGDVRLGTSGVALATRPNGIIMTATAGTVRFTDIFSRAGISGTGQAIAGGNATAATSIALNAAGGAVAFGTLTAGQSLTASATTALTGTNATSTAGPLTLTGTTGLTVPTVVSGGTTTLSAVNGALTIATNLQSAGTATAIGQSIFLRSLGALSFTSLNATAGGLDVSSVGALTVTTPQATGAVTLASTGSTVAFGTATAGTSFSATAAGTVTGTSATGTAGPVTISGATGITIPTIVSGSTTALTAANGAITIATNLQSAGLVAASARSAFIRSTGALSFGTLTATAGNLDVATAGALSLVTPQATGSITLASSGGNVALGTATAGTSLTATSPGTITGTSATATTGPLTLTGATGVTVPTVVSGGTVSLSAVNGAVTVATNLQPGGTATAVGQSIFLRSLGPLSFTGLNATAGNLDVSSVGALSIATPSATGSVTLASTGGSVAFGTATAGTSFTVIAVGTAAGTSVTATSGPVVITGTAGITVPTIVSGGTTTLNAANGAISVATDLQSAGLVTASGRSVFLRSTGSLTGGALSATAGDIDVAAGTGLTAATVQASGDVILGAGTALSPGAVTSGRDIVLTAQALQAGSLNAPRDLRIVTTGMAQATGTIAAGRALIVNAGQTSFQGINGGSVAITSAQGVIFTNLTSGSTVALNAGDDATGTSIVAVGNVTVTSGRNINFGPVTAANLIANATGSLTMGNVTASEDIRLSTGGAPAVMTTGALTAGDDIVLSGNAVTTGNLTTTGLGPDAEGNGAAIDLQLNRITTGTVNSAGSILLAASQPIGFTSTTSRTSTIVRSFGAITGGNSTAGTTLDIQGGNIDVGNGQAGGALNYTNFNPTENIRAGTLTGASVSASSRGTLAIGPVNAPGAVNLLGDLGLTVVSATSTGGDLQLSAPTSGPITSGALRAGGNLSVSSQAGNDVLTTLDAGGRILIGAGGGTLRFDRATAGGLVGVSAGGNIGFGTVTAGGTFQMQTAGAITGIAATSNGGAPNIVQGDTGITLPTLVTNGVTVLSAVNGAITVATDLRSTGTVAATGRSVFLRSTSALALDNLAATAGAVDVSSVGALSVGQAIASGALTLASGGTASFTGVATGATVSVASHDIVIAANGRLGTLGTTTQLTLTNSSTQNRTFIGGTGGAGYSLSAAELGRLTANNITIIAPVIGTASTAFNSARLPDVSIDAFAFAANTGLGANGIFAIQTGGKVRVTGAVSFTGMGNGQTFAIRGDEAVEVLDAGRIALNGTGALGGTLDLTSRNIVASSSAALADFAAATTVTAISDRAGKNDGAPDDGGYLQANAIRATLLNSTLIIQNTGAATTTANRDYSGRRGFTVGAGGFTVVQGGTNPVRIAINGRQVGATTPLGGPTIGGFVTGLDMIPLIKIVPLDLQAGAVFQVPASGVLTAAQLATAPRLFDTTSTVNGCAITGGSGCRVVPNDPIRDILQGDFGEGSVGNLLPLALIQLKDYVTPGDEPLIDEPVTGAGNDDLWSVDDTKPKCDPAKEKCPA